MTPSRICLIGNSHIAAIKEGWEQIAEANPSVQTTWFGAPRDALAGLRLAGQSLVPMNDALKQSIEWTSGGQQEIALADYDAFALIGVGLSFTAVARSYLHYRTTAQSQVPPPRHLLSAAAQDAILLEQVRGSLGLVLARLIRRVASAPIFLVTDPLPAENALRHPKEQRLWAALADSPDGSELLRRFDTTISEQASLVGATRIYPPSETRAGQVFSREAMREGARRMREGSLIPYPDDEYSHLGPHYGAIMMGELIRLLSAGSREMEETWAARR